MRVKSVLRNVTLEPKSLRVKNALQLDPLWNNRPLTLLSWTHPPALSQRFIAGPSPFFSLGRKATWSHGFNQACGCSTTRAAQPWGHCSSLSNVWCLFLVTAIRKHDICFQLGPLYSLPTSPLHTHTHTLTMAHSLQFHCLLHYLEWACLIGVYAGRLFGDPVAAWGRSESIAQRLNIDCVQKGFETYYIFLTNYL